MGDFKQRGGKRFGDRGGFSGKSWRGSEGRDRGPVTMHQAICAQCGKSCEVPFRPTGDKPVYCNACFGGKKETGDNRRDDRFSQKSFNSYKAPVRVDFESNAGKGNSDEVKKQLEILNVKMDRLIKAVEAMANIKPLIAEEKSKKAEKIIPVVKAKKLAKKISKKRKK